MRDFAEQLLDDGDVLAQVAEFVASLEPACRPTCSGRSSSRSPCPACRTSIRAATSSTCRWSTPTTGARSTSPTGGPGWPGSTPAAPPGLSDEKLLVVSRALRLRRDHPEWFGADVVVRRVATSTRAPSRSRRADVVVTVVSRLTGRSPGWDGETLARSPLAVA